MSALQCLHVRELVDQLRTYRFTVLFILIQVVAIASVVLGARQARQDHALYDQVVTQSREQLGKSDAWGALGADVWFVRAPSPVPFIAGAGDRQFPDLFRVGAFELSGPEHRRAPSPVLAYGEPMDWGWRRVCW